MFKDYRNLLSQFPTIAVEDMLQQLGIQKIEMKSKMGIKMDALLRIFNKQAIIFVKPDLDENYQKFVLYHEIGHYLIHYNPCMEYHFLAERYRNRTEAEANYFGCYCLLVDEDIQDICVPSLLMNKGVPEKIAYDFWEYELRNQKNDSQTENIL